MSRSTDPLAQTLSVDSHRTCRNCGTHVDKSTIRVFGVDGVLHHCMNCESPPICARDLRQGAGKDPDYDPVEDRGQTSENHPIFPGGDGQ